MFVPINGSNKAWYFTNEYRVKYHLLALFSCFITLNLPHSLSKVVYSMWTVLPVSVFCLACSTLNNLLFLFRQWHVVNYERVKNTTKCSCSVPPEIWNHWWWLKWSIWNRYHRVQCPESIIKGQATCWSSSRVVKDNGFGKMSSQGCSWLKRLLRTGFLLKKVKEILAPNATIANCLQRVLSVRLNHPCIHRRLSTKNSTWFVYKWKSTTV